MTSDRSAGAARAGAGEGTAATGPRVYLHVGTMKSGTTYLQRRLKANSKDLARDGLLVPAATGASVVAAVREVLEIVAPRGPESVAGRWDELRGLLASWDGRAGVVSMEFLSLASEAQAQRICSDLQPSPVEVLITTRDLGRVIPSSWQESTQNGAIWPYDRFVESIVAEDDERPGSKFWRQQNIGPIIEAWKSVVGPDHVHVITVPPSGADADQLWNRYCSAFGLNGADYPDVIDESRANHALGYASAEFMRRFNEELRGTQVTKAQYLEYAKRMVAKRSLNQRKQEAKVVLPARYGEWAVERSERMVAEVEASGVHVIGDLRELVPVIDPDAPDSYEVSDDDVLDAAVDTIALLLLELTKSYERGRYVE